MVILLFLVAILPTASLSLQWLPPLDKDEPDIVNVCYKQSFTLPANFTLAHGETVADVRWVVRHESGSDEMVALHSGGRFLSMPAYFGRVAQSPAGDFGIVVSHVVAEDIGNYTVQVETSDADNILRKFERTVHVDMIVEPMSQRGRLRATLDPKAVYVSATDDLHVQLTCGLLDNEGTPPVDVIWTTPDGTQLTSTSRANGSFHLLLENPVSGGEYSCSLAPSPPVSCLAPSSQLLDNAAVEVDSTQVRLALMEAGNARVTVQLRADLASTKDQVAALKRRASRQVSFHATLKSSSTFGSGTPLLLPNVLLNHGHAFFPSNGSFLAPDNGTYFFAASSGAPSTTSYNVGMTIMNGDTVIVSGAFASSSYNRGYGNVYNTASCQAIVHLEGGDRVWLRSDRSSSFWGDDHTSFSGFLIAADEVEGL